MKRYASEDESKNTDIPFELSRLQEEKLLIFFKHYLDGDCDGFVFEHDFHQFSEVTGHTVFSRRQPLNDVTNNLLM